MSDLTRNFAFSGEASRSPKGATFAVGAALAGVAEDDSAVWPPSTSASVAFLAGPEADPVAIGGECGGASDIDATRPSLLFSGAAKTNLPECCDGSLT